jgi:asparagine synthase (glutamine-hydrolysing)
MSTQDGRLVIVFNGEVYNFLEIKTLLLRKGYKFRTSSDTEVILYAYQEYGVECLKHFNGMWSLVIYDTEKRQAFLARDRYGVKPLYYYQDTEKIVVCSEADAIGRQLKQAIDTNNSYITRLLNADTGAFGTTETHLKNVHSIPPGSYAFASPGKPLSITQWYTLERKEVPQTFEDQTSEFQNLLWDAVSIRLRSDVPVATCLSGGIDSGSIVCILHDLETKGVVIDSFSHRSFTASFPGTTLDETRYTNLLSNQKGIDLDNFVVDCPSTEELETAMRFCDGPMPTLAFFPIWRLYKHIKTCGISVTLDGQGADEMLGGYYIGLDALASAWQSKSLRRYLDMINTYRELHPNAPDWILNDRNWIRQYAKSEVMQAIKSPIKLLLEHLGFMEKRRSLHPTPPPCPGVVNPQDQEVGNWLSHRLWNQFFRSPLPFLLHQYDRCSMANGVECRMPFMDYRLVEFTYSLPLDSRIGTGYTKRILREAMRGKLPDEIRLNKRKTGFNAPFLNWITGPLENWTKDIINSQEFLQSPFFDGRLIKRLFDDFITNQSEPEIEKKIWPALHVHFWTKCRSN